jgi:hypothetical protein
MKLNELIKDFTIYMTNEEQELFDSLDQVKLREEFSERQCQVLENLVKKSLVTKIIHKGNCYWMRNEDFS